MTFDSIYRRNAWNGVESLSGPGSGTSATRALVPAVLSLVGDLHIRSVLDIGCGDGFWLPDLPGYMGADVAERALIRARARHPDRLYVVADFRAHVPPPFDLVIIRDVIQHLPFDSALRLLGNVGRSGSAWLLASTYIGTVNTDIPEGGFYSPDLTAHPFRLATPDRLIFDGYAYHDTDEPRDPAKHLGLWRL